MKIIRLTESDYCVLLMMLGMAVGSHSTEDVPKSFKRLIDWVITQGGDPGTYTYWMDKKEIKELKEKEISEEIINGD